MNIYRLPVELLAALGFEVKVTSSGSDNKEAAAAGEESPVKGSRPEKGKKASTDAVDSDCPPVVSANGTTAVVTEGAKKPRAAKKEKAVVAEKVDDVENNTESGSDGARPKDQLIYLSKIIGFKVSLVNYYSNFHENRTLANFDIPETFVRKFRIGHCD